MNNTKNIEKILDFSNTRITAKSVINVENYRINNRTIVINIGKTSAEIVQTPENNLRPLHSSIYNSVVIEKAEHIIILSIIDGNNLGGIVSEPGWIHYWKFLNDILGAKKAGATGYDPTTPLWKSSQIDIGKIDVNSDFFSGNDFIESENHEYKIKVNLWFSPQNTDCSIHNTHDFIEIHTQIHGVGRMQKFRENDKSTLYEDIVMGTGYTTPVPFCSIEPKNQYVYPWHQYYADTDCIWLAIEFHRT